MYNMDQNNFLPPQKAYQNTYDTSNPHSQEQNIYDTSYPHSYDQETYDPPQPPYNPNRQSEHYQYGAQSNDHFDYQHPAYELDSSGPFPSRTRFSPADKNALMYALWAVSGLAVLLSLFALAMAASISVGFTSELQYPNLPGKLAWVIALSVLTLFFFLTITILHFFAPAPWTAWLQPSMSAAPWAALLTGSLLTLFWLGGSVAAFYTCADICGPVETDLAWVKYIGKCCTCQGLDVSVSCETLNEGIGDGDLRVITSNPDGKSGVYKVGQAANLITMFLFLAATVLWYFVRARSLR